MDIMSKNLKDEITDILDKSGLVDIHLAQGLIIQPTIEAIEEYVIKARIIEHRIDCDHCNTAEEMKQVSNCDRLVELKKGLKK